MIIKRKNKLSLIGILLIIIGLFIPLYKKSVNLITNKNQDNKISTYIEETSLVTNDNERETTQAQISLNYIAVLEIPDISLKKGLLSLDDKYNDISYNIQILTNSKMPNINNSNLILAAHNGNSQVSYFKDLSKLNQESLIYIYYLGIKYVYKLNNIYEVTKNNKIEIIRDRTINTLTLITCKDNSDDKQVVYIAYLINKETY